ncbi:MAG: hypothetical protein RCG15_08835 [Candidatus Rickettsia vulgarisii]
MEKNKETKLFEEIIYEIIDDHTNKTNNITFQEGVIKRKGESINLQDLLDKVNFTHVSIAKEDIAKYTKIQGGTPTYKAFQDDIQKKAMFTANS